MTRPKLHIAAPDEPRGPSRSFLSLTRNIDKALNPPSKFVPTQKADGDVII